MSTQQKVAVITGASQGIGAALVKAYRDAGYRVVANSRSIRPSADPGIAVPGDISDPKVAESRIVRLVRWSNSVPTWFSRKAMARLTAAGERRSRRAAPATLPSSRAATNTLHRIQAVHDRSSVRENSRRWGAVRSTEVRFKLSDGGPRLR